jgi:chemotaxis protein CheD
MSLLVVGVADMKVDDQKDTALATYALGSCIAVAIHDPVASVGGLLHFMLPESSIDPENARTSPFMFADTGIPLLFRTAYDRGADKRRLAVKLVGGAQVMDAQGVFNIGKRNYLAARKILWKAGVLVEAEEVGGTLSRSVRLEIGTGRLWLRTAGGAEQEMTAAARSPRMADPAAGPLAAEAVKGAASWRSPC